MCSERGPEEGIPRHRKARLTDGGNELKEIELGRVTQLGSGGAGVPSQARGKRAQGGRQSSCRSEGRVSAASWVTCVSDGSPRMEAVLGRAWGPEQMGTVASFMRQRR